jgi:hypothetical protein
VPWRRPGTAGRAAPLAPSPSPRPTTSSLLRPRRPHLRSRSAFCRCGGEPSGARVATVVRARMSGYCADRFGRDKLLR